MKRTTDLKKVAQRLFQIAKQRYGRCWSTYIKEQLWRDQDGLPNELDLMNKFFLKKGFELISGGYYRIVFGWKDLVIKIDVNKERSGNVDEKNTYHHLIKTLPLTKYFMCPLIKSLKIGKRTVLFYPRVACVGDDNIRCNNIQKEMMEIGEGLFDDLHEYNVGTFCDGLIAIDFNFGFDENIERYKEINEFRNKRNGFWIKYINKFDRTINRFYRKYCAA